MLQSKPVRRSTHRMILTYRVSGSYYSPCVIVCGVTNSNLLIVTSIFIIVNQNL